MFNIMHISDLHFGPFFMPSIAESVLKSAAALKPDCIVASGDFTQRATIDEYAAARKFLDQLPPVPLVVCPGNHDVPLYRLWERIFAPHQNYQQYISKKLNDLLELPQATIVSLDSTAPLRAIKNGRIRREHLVFARDCFAASPPEKVRIVVAHHHFAPAPDYERSTVMPKARRAMDVFEACEVELVLGGHLHRAYVGNSLDIYPGKNRNYGIVISQSGTTTSRRGRAREREKNSFNWIRVTEDSIRITHYMYFDDAQGFAPFSRHIYPRRPRQYFADPPEGTSDLFGR